jgi:hypothetical protein
MTELSLKWKQIFDEISTADSYLVGKINYYNLASILEDLYVENAELKARVEQLEKVNKEKLSLLNLIENKND